MTSFQRLQRRIGGFPIEYPAAALMAAAVVFVTLALPDWRFEAAINATGLPGIVSAAQPPLGTTARVLAAIGLGILSFLAVWFGLRALDAKPQATDFPAFRTADLHPDAPRRRPILAGAEFGAPVDDLPPIEEQVRRRPLVTEPLPSFLAPQTPEAEARAPLFTTEVVAEPEFGAGAEPAEDVPAFLDAGPLLRQKRDFANSPRVAPVEVEQDDAEGGPEAVDTPPPAAVPTGDHDEEEESVSELMARLESGLTRRGSRPVPSGGAQEELQRALGDLNRVSGRG